MKNRDRSDSMMHEEALVDLNSKPAQSLNHPDVDLGWRGGSCDVECKGGAAAIAVQVVPGMRMRVFDFADTGNCMPRTSCTGRAALSRLVSVDVSAQTLRNQTHATTPLVQTVLQKRLISPCILSLASVWSQGISATATARVRRTGAACVRMGGGWKLAIASVWVSGSSSAKSIAFPHGVGTVCTSDAAASL
eukprot:1555659-Rhodomonas_salina.1